MPKFINNITIENAKIAFRNFGGKEGRFNVEGKRNFCVFLDPETAENLKADGWNVKQLRPKDEYEEPQNYIQVSVVYGKAPPKIVLVTSKGKNSLDESEINILDWAEIKNVDLIIRPYVWEMGGKTGVKAYVKSMYVTIAEDKLEEKYEDLPDASIPDSAQNALSDVFSDPLPF